MEMSRIPVESFILLLLLVSECHPEPRRCPSITRNSETTNVKVVHGLTNYLTSETANGQYHSVVHLYTETTHFRISFSDPARASCASKASSANTSDLHLTYFLYLSGDDDTLLYGCQELNMELFVEFFCECFTPDMEKKMKTIESAFENRRSHDDEKILKFPSCDLRLFDKHYLYILCGFVLFTFILGMVVFVVDKNL